MTEMRKVYHGLSFALNNTKKPARRQIKIFLYSSGENALLEKVFRNEKDMSQVEPEVTGLKITVKSTPLDVIRKRGKKEAEIITGVRMRYVGIMSQISHFP